MPIYCYKCEHCGSIFEMLRPMARRNISPICPQCKETANERYRIGETVQVRPDIEPYFNHALGEWVTSRRDCNTKIYGSGGYPLGHGGSIWKGDKRFYGDEEMFNAFQPRDGGQSMRWLDEQIAKGLEDSNKELPDDSPNPQEA